MARKPAIVNGEPVPNVSKREIQTLDVLSDWAMESLPERAFNFADPAEREQMRDWLRHIIGNVAHSMEWSYRRAIDSALTQTDTLMRDPLRYEQQATRRKARKEKYRADRERWDKEAEERERERRETLEQLAAEGRVVPMKGFVWNLPCCTGKDDPLNPEPTEPRPAPSTDTKGE